MAFASIFVPEFAVQAVVRAEPGLRGQPLALLEGAPPREHVTAVNAAARRAGIQPGVTRASAAQIFGVHLRPRSAAQERIAHQALLDVCWSISPRIEDTASDTVALDLSGLEQLLGSQQEIAGCIAGRAAACGLMVNVAVAANIEAAQVAARGYGGITVISPGREQSCLSGLSIQALSPSEEIRETLQRWGVRSCGALAALPVRELSERLGQAGVRLHEQARGTGSRALLVAQPAHFFEEEMELEDAVEDLEPLSFLLGRLLDQLCARLAARSLAAGSIRIRLELQPCPEKPFDVFRERIRNKVPPGLYEKTLQIPFPTRNSKILLQLLRLRLQSAPPSGPILKIRMGAEPGRTPVAQNGLFAAAAPDANKLEITLARLAAMVGRENVGSPKLADTHRPGHFQSGHFQTEPDAADFPGRPAPDPARAAGTFRAFRPPVTARLHLQQGRPTHIFFQGLQGAVTAASGPWRTSGEWWTENLWQQDEWDLEIRFSAVAGQPGPQANSAPQGGLYRVCYDTLRGSWLVKGIYD